MLGLCNCMSEKTIFLIVIVITGIFLIVASFLFLYVISYTKRKRKHKEEKLVLENKFQTELIQTEFEVQEHTRKNIASELHDNIGQLLSLTNVTLASINVEDKEKAKQKVDMTSELVSKSIKELRQLSKIIHGEHLIKQGLVETIEQEINWLQRNDQFKVNFTFDPSVTYLTNPDKDLFIYRLLQESINNIIKHAGANLIDIKLYLSMESLFLSVSDNGNGMDKTDDGAIRYGMGLTNMQRRIELLKGSFSINTVPKMGTSLTFQIPYP